MAEGGGSEIPAPLELKTPQYSYDVWALWKAMGKQHLLSEIANEPIALMNDVLQIDAHYEALKRLEDGNQND